MESKPTKKPGVCDTCGGEVYQRADDKEDVICTRLEVYETGTRPLKDYYKTKGSYVEIDGTGSGEQVFERITKVMQVKG